MHSTILLARANGAGTILASARNRFRVDNWSVGTDDVYGYPCDEAGKPCGPLQMLPAHGLRVVMGESK